MKYRKLYSVRLVAIRKVTDVIDESKITKLYEKTDEEEEERPLQMTIMPPQQPGV